MSAPQAELAIESFSYRTSLIDRCVSTGALSRVRRRSFRGHLSPAVMERCCSRQANGSVRQSRQSSQQDRRRRARQIGVVRDLAPIEAVQCREMSRHLNSAPKSVAGWSAGSSLNGEEQEVIFRPGSAWVRLISFPRSPRRDQTTSQRPRVRPRSKFWLAILSSNRGAPGKYTARCRRKWRATRHSRSCGHTQLPLPN